MTAKPKTPATPESRIRAAFAKAAKTSAYVHVAPQGPGKYYLAGSTLGTIYTVRQLDREPGLGTRWECNCPAGAHQIICYHRAAVVLYLGWMDGYDVIERDGDVFLTRKASAGYLGYLPPVEMAEAPQDDAPHPADTVDTFELNLPTDGDEPVHHTVHADTVAVPATCPRCTHWLDDKGNCTCCDYAPGKCACPLADAFGTTADDEEAALDRYLDVVELGVFQAHEALDCWPDAGRTPPTAIPFDEPRDDQSDEYEADDEPARGDGYCPHGLYIQRSTDCDLCWAAEHPEQTEEPDVDDTVNPEDVEPADARTIDLDDPFIATLEAEEQARQQAAKDRRNEPDRWPGRIEGRRTEPRRTVLDRELPTRPATPEYEALGRRLAYGDLDLWV